MQTRPPEIPRISRGDILIPDILRARNMRRRITPRQEAPEARCKGRACRLTHENRWCRRIVWVEPSSVPNQGIAHIGVIIALRFIWRLCRSRRAAAAPVFGLGRIDRGGRLFSQASNLGLQLVQITEENSISLIPGYYKKPCTTSFHPRASCESLECWTLPLAHFDLAVPRCVLALIGTADLATFGARLVARAFDFVCVTPLTAEGMFAR